MHFNRLWCHLFNVLSTAKGITFFQICPSKDLTIARLVDQVFPAIKSTKNQPCPFITTKTVAYIFSLVIDSVTLHHADFPHLQHEATILHELDSMTPDAFRVELHASLTSFYEDILKVPGAGGRPQAKIIKKPEALQQSLLQPNPHLSRMLRPSRGFQSRAAGQTLSWQGRRWH